MAQLNANTPYIQAYVRKEVTGYERDLEGYIFGVKSMLNYPMLFHFQSEIGAVFWNLPISAFMHDLQYDTLSASEETRLQLLQTWDCQSTAIATTCFKFLQHKRVDVFCRDRKWRSGMYHFTIDDYETDCNEINTGYANDLDSKCFHFIELEDGNFCIQPNNLLRWHNADFITPYDRDNPPKIKITNPLRSAEDVDRSYGNSAYYFYTHDTDERSLVKKNGIVDSE
jgi:hypothetical protein